MPQYHRQSESPLFIIILSSSANDALGSVCDLVLAFIAQVQASHRMSSASKKRDSPIDESAPSKRQKRGPRVEYSGFQLPSAKSWVPSRLDINSTTPSDFFAEYISQRKPVVLTNIDRSGLPCWGGDEDGQWGLRWLSSKCSEKSVNVEKRVDAKDKFGQGKEIPMTMGDLIRSLEQGDETLYLSTQDLGTDEEGRPDICCEPIQTLLSNGDLPPRPLLFGKLVPQVG